MLGDVPRLDSLSAMKEEAKAPKKEPAGIDAVIPFFTLVTGDNKV
jgi:hypothetical protein